MVYVDGYFIVTYRGKPKMPDGTQGNRIKSTLKTGD
jgi:hypothetical protein